MKLFTGKSIGFKLFVLNATMLGLLVVMGVIGFLSLRSNNQVVISFSQIRLPAIEKLIQADRDLNQLLTAERTFLFADKDSDAFSKSLKSYEENLEQAAERFNFYKTLMNSPEEKELANQYEEERIKWMALSRKVLRLRQEGSDISTNLAIALSLSEAEEAFENMRGKIDELEELNLKMARNAEQANSAGFKRMVIFWVLTVLAGFIGGGILFRLIGNSITAPIRNVIQRLETGSQQVASASGQLSSSSQSLSQGASEQASSLEEVSSSLEEMASMTKQNSENSHLANNLAKEANTASKQSADAMAKMSGAINKIKISSDETAKIIKTIDEIAMQTNLLALNAAVEAARAGEAGRGFAVVAEEVRNLAQRSAEAAKNTATLIEESQQNSESGVTASEEVNRALLSISDKVQKVNQLIAEVAAASEEQSQGINQVNTAVAQMDKVTQNNAANAEESASASEELSGQAENLSSMVADLVDVVNGATNAGNTRSAYRTQESVPLATRAIHAVEQRKNRNSRTLLLRTTGGEISPDKIIPLDDDKYLSTF